jgi:hypothetical protein
MVCQISVAEFPGLLKCSGAAAGGLPAGRPSCPRARDRSAALVKLQEIAKPMGLTLNGVDVVNVNDLEGSFSAMGRFASPTGS